MAYRFTNTDKWNDVWFCELTASAKLLFLYFCDCCDVAGFFEINIKKIAFDCGISKKEVEDSLGQLNSKLLFSIDGKHAFLKNFVKHQKNLPLNQKNNAHLGIIKRLNENLQLFNLQSIDGYFTSPLLAPKQGLGRGTGKGNSNSKRIEDKDKGGMGEKEKEERVKFAEFVSMTNGEYSSLVAKLGNEKDAKRCIEILDNYKGASGKEYKSDYRAILNWVVGRFKNESSGIKNHDSEDFINNLINK